MVHLQFATLVRDAMPFMNLGAIKLMRSHKYR
jgi:hypothetical protein